MSITVQQSAMSLTVYCSKSLTQI